MSQTIEISNPTSGSVAYMARDCRLTIPAEGKCTHTLDEKVVQALTAHLETHFPLITVTPQEAEPEAQEAAAPEAAETKPKAPARRKSASTKGTADNSEDAAE